MNYDAAWFFSLMPQFSGGTPPETIQAWLDIAAKEVCWAKRCRSFDRALLWQTALFLQELGYPVVPNEDGTLPEPIPSDQRYDQVIKKHQVGDVITEFQVVDNAEKTSPNGNGLSGLADRLNKLKLRCLGTVTNTHVMGGRGLHGAGGGCGC